MQGYTQEGKLQIAEILHSFIEQEALPGTGINGLQFWQSFEELLAELSPINAQLLAKRESLQKQIDQFYREKPNYTLQQYKQFLTSIGYLEPTPAPFSIDTVNVDDEIAMIAGPQLVVPINNARYAINAANSRWGSLYDAFYGTDVIAENKGNEIGKSYNPQRGELVVKKSA